MKMLRNLVALPLLALPLSLMRAEEAAVPALPNPTSTSTSTTATPTPPPADAAAAPAKAKSKTLPSALAHVSGVTVPLTPRFRQIRDRTNVLFHDRLETPPPPDPRYNPFRAPGTVPIMVATVGNDGSPTMAPAAPSNDLVTLQQVVATLKIGGTITRQGRLFLTINSGLYKERDIISITVQDQPVHLRVRQITATSVMFSLNDAEYTLKF